MTSKLDELNLSIVGGPQGPKALLDAVRQAVMYGNVDTLKRLSKDFLSIKDNIQKCVDESGNSILHLALGKDSTTLQYVLRTFHPNVNAVNFQGRSPLHEAVTQNYVECCEILLSNGASDSLPSSTLSTPFHTAAACGSIECMEVLLKRCDNPVAKVNELDRNHSSALHKCAFDGDVRVSRWLIEHGAAVDAVDCMGLTPLLVAIKMGQSAVVEYLLLQKADCNMQDWQGNSCAHFCAIRCDTTILKMLVRAGANLNVTNVEGCNPLHVAAMHQRPDSREWEDLLAILLLEGCDPQCENASRKKPFDYVARGYKKLFIKEEMQRRHEQELKIQKELENNFESAIALRCTWAAKMQEGIAKREEMAQLEDERLAKEVAAWTTAEADARTALEELREMVRFQEDEIVKKKIALEKILPAAK